MFLNEADRLAILRDFGANAWFVADALQRLDCEGFAEGIGRSWDLNQRINAGTSPTTVQALIAPVTKYLAAGKLMRLLALTMGRPNALAFPGGAVACETRPR